jgi:diamine N-acetyltransferase
VSNPDEPVLWLRGAKVALGPFERRLVEQYWRWEQDPRVVIGEGRQTPESLEARVEGFGHQARNTLNQARFTVYDLTADTTARPVGTTALLIDHHVRAAEYIIKLGSEGRGRHLATEATRLTLDYGFHITNLRSIWLKVLEHNVRGIQAYQAAGFKEAGRLRRSGYWLGADCDEVIMDMLPEEFPGLSAVRHLIDIG